MNLTYPAILAMCRRHADRLNWSMQRLGPLLPLDEDKLKQLDDVTLAVLDQFSLRFAKLQDAMGAKLFPAALERMREPGELVTFLDQLHRLEKVGAVASADQWLLLREVRNAFAHDYPDDPAVPTAVLNRALPMAQQLLDALDTLERFIERFATE